MREAPHWSEIHEKGTALALRFLVGVYRVFGRPLSVILTQLAALYFFLKSSSIRAASRAYLRRIAARPDGAAALGRRPGAVAIFLHVRAFAISILDRMELWLGKGDAFEFEVTGLEELHRVLDSGRGALILGSHLGSFDALRALAERDGRVVNVLMFTQNAATINAFFERLDPGVRMHVLPMEPGSLGSVLQIRACIERGELVAMLGDRVAPNERRCCRVTLLGDPIDLPEAPYLLAGLLGCPLFFTVALRSGRGRYRVFAELLAERVDLTRGAREKVVQELAAKYAGRLEHYCMMAPYEWFNFYDYWRERAT